MMSKSKLLLISLGQSLGTLVYIGLVAWLLMNGNTVFGQMRSYLAPVAFLLLFVLSATVVGALMLGKPVAMYIDGQKQDAWQLFGYSVLWLFLITAILLIILLARAS